MADAPGEETDDIAGGPPGRLEARFEQGLSLFRIVVVVPVIVLLLSALASFAYGTDVFIRSVVSVVENPHLTSHNLGFLLLLTDLFLVGATLMIAGFGFYDLFISRIDATGPGLRLPGWLRMHDLNDLKARVISMIILVAAVTFGGLGGGGQGRAGHALSRRRGGDRDRGAHRVPALWPRPLERFSRREPTTSTSFPRT